MPPNSTALRTEIIQRLAVIGQGPLDASSRAFFESLGYRSRRTLAVHSVTELRQLLDLNGLLTEQNSCLSRWRSVDFLFQLTDSELAGNGDQGLLLDDHGPFDS